jgi:hypothetical protein
LVRPVDKVAREGDYVRIQLKAKDADGTALTYFSNLLPGGTTLDLKFQAKDAGGATTTLDVVVSIASVLRAPVVKSTTVSTFVLNGVAISLTLCYRLTKSINVFECCHPTIRYRFENLYTFFFSSCCRISYHTTFT